ncbi:hypothetical protein Osc7112_3356 [Oscillatoria nigro-viridis PCC 7112]|uniref:Uncharacterized protein n=1 Tax=Phormidium nigroviride PCC 7112 TaxID=179408 RepID=K9VKG8_9CYAN|nr:hypothetical protein Osc7112_3356 [Oscillatoria nigro-viridis PCC 7112]
MCRYSVFQVYEVHPRNRVSLQLSPLVLIQLLETRFLAIYIYMEYAVFSDTAVNQVFSTKPVSLPNFCDLYILPIKNL